MSKCKRHSDIQNQYTCTCNSPKTDYLSKQFPHAYFFICLMKLLKNHDVQKSKLCVVIWVLWEISLAHAIAENFNQTSLHAYEY